MNQFVDTIGLPLSFIFISTLLIWILISAKGNWKIKLITMLIMAYLSLSTWFSIENLLGWPISAKLPAKFTIHWIMIKEPIKKEHPEDGGIYVWATKIYGLGTEEEEDHSYFIKLFQPQKESRLYKIAYTKELHKQAETIMGDLKAGKEFKGTLQKDGKMGKSKGKGIGNGKGKEGNSDGSLSQEQELHFYQLPPAKLPPKITGEQELSR